MSRFLVRLAYAVALGLVGAGIVHIAVLFLMPAYSPLDVWSRLAERAEPYRMVRLDADEGSAPLIPAVDPLFDAVACRFDLGDGVVRLVAPGSVSYWSVSVYDRVGQNVFSFNDRTSSDGTLDIVIATPVQMIELRNALPEEFERSIFVEADIEEGIVAIRAFVPDESWTPGVTAWLSEIGCASY